MQTLPIQRNDVLTTAVYQRRPARAAALALQTESMRPLRFRVDFNRSDSTELVTKAESIMLAKIRRLPSLERAELDAFLDSLLERVEEERRYVREAFEMSGRSLARAWGIDDEDTPQAGL